MGMAASQARFLGLTARKSNVEYQGQQINQQRTALSNESANLYNQMLELNVPTPPSTNDFYKTSYVLEDSASSYANSDYEISNMTKTYNRENEYTVTLTSKVEKLQDLNLNYTSSYTDVTKKTSGGKEYNVYKMTLNDGTKGSVQFEYNENDTDAFTGANGSLAAVKGQLYKAEAGKGLKGYDECCTDKDKTYYFYQDANGRNNFIDQETLDALIANAGTGKKGPSVNVATINTYTTPVSTQVTAIMEKSSTGRYSSITINNDETYANDLKGRTFSLNVVQEMDQEAYDNAMNDYTYQKNLYEKSISDINAQTEIIQSEDQQLELRLQQLNTEQSAISTEMDSVSKVIDDNVEKTFKVFA